MVFLHSTASRGEGCADQKVAEIGMVQKGPLGGQPAHLPRAAQVAT